MATLGQNFLANLPHITSLLHTNLFVKKKPEKPVHDSNDLFDAAQKMVQTPMSTD